jgi:hypothetical protein
MFLRPQTLAFAVLALTFAPALAQACDEEAKATAKACVVPPQACTATAIAVSVESVDRVVPAGTRRPEWEPGHLIERDSLKTAPEKDQDSQNWVKVSIGNVKFSWRHTYKSSKKTKSRVVVAPGPRRS